jgi:hypothetical protein
MAFSVTLTKQLSLTTDPAYQPGSVRCIITVTSVVGFVDLGIFVDVRDTASGVYRYSFVANPKSLEDYNYNDFTAQWTRVGLIDKVFLRADLADEFIISIEAAIQRLCSDMQILQDLAAPVTETISS